MAAAREVYRFSTPVESPNKRCLTWTCYVPEMMSQFALDLEGLPRSMWGHGCSRLLKGAREKAGHSIATLIFLEVSHVKTWAGFQVLYHNFKYVVIQDSGEIHFPKLRSPNKELNRLPLRLSSAEEQRIRATAAQDLMGMLEEGYPLSNLWRAQLGVAEDPHLVEVAASATMSALAIAEQPVLTAEETDLYWEVQLALIGQSSILHSLSQ